MSGPINPEIQSDWAAKEYEKALHRRLISYDSPPLRKYDWLLNPKTQEDVVTGSITFGEFLYKLARIDPLVVLAADFSSVDSIENSLSFTNYVHQFKSYSGESLEGVFNRLQGYVAEQAVAMDLSYQGYDVQFPDSPTQPGFDLLVDGQPMQVKCLTDPSGVYEHFDKYPDIPILLNADLADLIGDQENIYPCPGITSDSIKRITRDSVESAHSSTDFHVSIISLGVSTCSNAYSWMKGTTDGKHMLINITTDIIGRSVVSGAGQWLGALGYLLSPAGGVIGQALGASIGAFGGGKVARHFRRILVSEQYAELSLSFSKLLIACVESEDIIINNLQSKINVFQKENIKTVAKKVALESIIHQLEKELSYRNSWRRRFSSAAKQSEKINPREMVELFLNSQVEYPIHISKISSQVASFTSTLSALDAKCKKLKIQSLIK